VPSHLGLINYFHPNFGNGYLFIYLFIYLYFTYFTFCSLSLLQVTPLNNPFPHSPFSSEQVGRPPGYPLTLAPQVSVKLGASSPTEVR
jgi:hypothetical protein